MKYIIVGLGSFGSSLAIKLTEMGNEVIGVDKTMSLVDLYKEKISYTICLDATDEFAVSGLPLKETDIVIIAIGKNQGTNVMVTALFKNFLVKKLFSRAINLLHEKVLLAIGVDEIVHPEEETAERLAKKLCLTNVIDSFELNSNYSIIEINLPDKFVGKTIKEIELKTKFNLLALTTIKETKKQSSLGNTVYEKKVQGVASANTVLKKNDILVVYGSNKDLRNFTNYK